MSRATILSHTQANECVTGQFGRALGPLIFCSLYWWAGRETAYAIGGAGMIAVCGLVFGGLKVPPGTEMKRKDKGKPADEKSQ